MAGGTNNVKRPGYATGGSFGFNQPGFESGGPNDPATGGSGYWGDLRGKPPVGMPNPAQMEAWKKQFGGWKPGGKAPPPWGQLQNQLGGLIGGGPPGQYGSSMPPGFPGYDNLPENWQDEGYTWQDPNNPNAKYNIIA